jgi:hypothetical protein
MVHHLGRVVPPPDFQINLLEDVPKTIEIMPECEIFAFVKTMHKDPPLSLTF